MTATEGNRIRSTTTSDDCQINLSLCHNILSRKSLHARNEEHSHMRKQTYNTRSFSHWVSAMLGNENKTLWISVFFACVLYKIEEWVVGSFVQLNALYCESKSVMGETEAPRSLNRNQFFLILSVFLCRALLLNIQ